MFRKTVGSVLTIIVAISAGGFTVRGQHSYRAADKIRLAVAKRGIGPEAKVKVTLHDKTKVEGYISEAGADSFTVFQRNTGHAHTFSYSEVAQVSKAGGGISTLSKVLIGAGVATGAIITWTIVKPALCDGGAQTRGPC